MIPLIIKTIVLVFGIIGCFRPIILLYLFFILPVAVYAPTMHGHLELFKLLSIGSINIYCHDYLLILIVILLVIGVFNDPQYSKNVINSPLSKFVLLLFFWNIMIGVLSLCKGFPVESVLRILSVRSLMFIVLFVPLIPDIQLKKDTFIKASLIIGFVLLCFAFVRYTFTYDVIKTSSGTLRSLDAISVVIFMFSTCYILFMSNLSQKSPMLAILIASIFGIGIVLAGHRSGLLVLFVAMGIFIFSYRFNLLTSVSLVFLATAVFLFSILIIPSLRITAGQSFFGDSFIRFNDTFKLENKTTEGRLSIWRESYDVFKEKPLLGLGMFPRFSVYIRDHAVHSRIDSQKVYLHRAPHNLFVNKIIYEGLSGFLLLIFFIITIFYQFKREYFKNQNYAIFLKSYIIVFFMFSFFNASYTDPAGRIYLFTVLGLLNTVVVNYKYNNFKS